MTLSKRHIVCFYVVLSLLTPNFAFTEDKRVGLIAFFGQEGIDTLPIRNALPFHEGSIVSFGDNLSGAGDSANRWKQDVKDAVKKVIGSEPTDVARVCCTNSGDLQVYIGLPGKSFRPIRYNDTPKRTVRLPEVLLSLDEEIDRLLFKAVLGGRIGEDDSEGYALSKDDPALRNKQLEFRDHARMNDELVFRVVDSSSDAKQRAIAATALGYLRQDDRQIAALVKASFDPDEEVRNNAVRALGVRLSANPGVARRIPAKRFISLLSSGTWSDRNKGLMVVFRLTQGRDPRLLRDLRSDALMPLAEAAQWETGHALGARIILGRIAEIDEAELWSLAQEEPPDAILRTIFEKR
jgi:hypothetical protein